MNATDRHSPGLVASLKSLGDAFSGTFRDRFELVRVEVQEEKYRLIQIFIWISALVVTGMLGLMFASLTLLYIFWDTARLAVFIGLTLFYSVSVALIIFGFKRQQSRDSKPLKERIEDIVANRPD